MRRPTADEWAGLTMLAVTVAVASPVLVGAAQTAVPRGWWIVLFATFVGTLVVAAAGERPTGSRYAALGIAAATCWVVVLTAPRAGLLPVLLVVVAAVAVDVVPLRVVLGLVVANTVVVAATTSQGIGSDVDVAVVTGFYLLIQLATALSTVAMRREQLMRRELAEAHVELQAASALLGESARTAERLRISRELHDLLGHQLTVLALELEAARHREGDRARAHVEQAHAVARDLLADVRTTVGELREEPSDLADALRNVVRDLPGLEVSVEVDRAVRVGDAQTAALVRTVQEVVTNTIRHADARGLHIAVDLDGGGGVVLEAVDDGRGASDPRPGHGLRGLAERVEALGGELAVDGSAGFKVTARMPAA